MKRIVFSFDDALLDFYTVVFPILKKYKIKATLNVITGFSDKTVISDYNCCSIKQLKEMLDYGIELSNHSNDHVCPETLEGYDIAQKKLKEWFPNYDVLGVVTPFTQDVPPNFFEWCNSNHIKYVRLDACAHSNKLQRAFIKMGLVSHKRLSCINNSHHEKFKKVKIVHSFAINARKSVDEYKDLIRLCCFNPKITLMFHSVLKTEEEFSSCPYPDGAWTANKFEELIVWILKKGYKICRQCDAL